MGTIELLVIGNEILSGATLDTNSQWLSRRLTALGGRIVQRTTVEDTPDAIGTAVRAARNRGTALLLTTGGLGPTFDDLTVDAIGQALGCPVRERADALAFVQRRYRELHEAGMVDSPDMLPPRRKMAAVPPDCDLILNPVGTAPGVLLRTGGFCVMAFPGVPRELHAMFDEPNVQAALRACLGTQVVREAEFVTPFHDESVLGPLCDGVMARVPGAYLKSRAADFEQTLPIPVLITCAGEDEAEVDRRVARARALLAEACGLPPDSNAAAS